MGRGYVIEHCISTFNEKKKREVEEKSYRAYITDTLMMIAENTTHFMGRTEMLDYGKYINKRWVELMGYVGEEQDKTPIEEDTRTAKEFADDIWKRIRGRKK